MDHYSLDWIFNPKVDNETRKYRFCYFVNEVQNAFSSNKILPFWNGLGTAIKDINQYLNQQKLLEHYMPKELVGINWITLSPEFKNESYVKELEELKTFLQNIYPEIKSLFVEGAELFQFVKKQLQLEPIGILPIYNKEGLLMLKNRSQSRIYSYAYKLSVQKESDFSHSALQTQFLGEDDLSIIKSPLEIKKSWIRSRLEFDHAAAFLIESKSNYPISHTLKPAAERVLYHYLMQNG
jgi:hypothetical protein